MSALAVAAGLFGSLIGSFLNVVAYRVPRGLSVVHPQSACPSCETPILPRDNVPVLGWLALRGRCRTCRIAIPARYPLVEAGTALLFAVVTFEFLPPIVRATTGAELASALLVLVAFLVLAGGSVALALIDLDVHRLPNAITLPLFVSGVVLLTAAGVLAGDGAAVLRAGAGALILGGAYLTLALAVRGGMGMGDVKLAAVLGLHLGFLGWAALAVGGIGAFLFGGLYGVVLLLTRRARRGSGVPFGPWMLFGALVAVLAGGDIASAYLTFIGLEA